VRPELKKQIVRNASAYKVARYIADGFVLAELTVALIALVWICATQYQQPEPDNRLIAVACFGSVVVFASVILQRELLQGFFDIADCALAKHESHTEV
jgi:hypothetical protein